MYEGISSEERKIATKLVDTFLRCGYALAVRDEEDVLVKRTKARAEIIAQLGHSELNKLVAYDGSDIVGWVLLIWGNGEDLISDSSVSFAIDRVIAQVT